MVRHTTEELPAYLICIPECRMLRKCAWVRIGHDPIASWTYQSAPKLKGYCNGGGPKVESTSNLPPTLWAYRPSSGTNTYRVPRTYFISIVLDIPVRTLATYFSRETENRNLDSPVGLRGVSSQHRSPGWYSSSKSMMGMSAFLDFL